MDRDCSNQPTNSACAESLLSGKYRSEDKFRCRSSTRARSWIAAVAENVVVELKAVDHLQPVHLAQVLTYLKLGGYPTGLLVNFNVAVLKRGLRRLAREI